jgi:predicted aspartyl protease
MGSVFAAPTVEEQPSEVTVTTPDLLFASPTRIDHIGRVVAPVMVDGKGPFRFIIDTGASSSTVSPQLAVTLGLPATGPSTMVVNGITGTAVVPAVAIERLQAGDLVIEDNRFPVIWAPLMAGADGILGIAGLRTHCVFVDFRRNRVEISHTLRRIDQIGFNKVSARVLGGGLLSIDGRIANVDVQAIIDTGSERTIGNLALHDALYARRGSGAAPEVTDVYGATTDVVSGEIHGVPSIKLGSVSMNHVTMVFGDFHIFQVWGMQTKPAVIIGMDVLGTVNAFGIDYRRSELYFQSVEREPHFHR